MQAPRQAKPPIRIPDDSGDDRAIGLAEQGLGRG